VKIVLVVVDDWVDVRGKHLYCDLPVGWVDILAVYPEVCDVDSFGDDDVDGDLDLDEIHRTVDLQHLNLAVSEVVFGAFVNLAVSEVVFGANVNLTVYEVVFGAFSHHDIAWHDDVMRPYVLLTHENVDYNAVLELNIYFDFVVVHVSEVVVGAFSH